MTSELPIVLEWAGQAVSNPRFVTNFPNNGLAVRLRDR
jgi:hypothetical protein